MTPKELICSHCKEFSQRGWMPGASGSISLMTDITPQNRSILVTPNSVNKDSLKMSDLFDLKFEFGTERIVSPTKLSINEAAVIADSAPFILQIYQDRSDVKCVVELCSEWFILGSQLAIKLWHSKADSLPDVLRISNHPLIKLVNGESTDELLIPIVEKLDVEAIRDCLNKFPKTNGFMVRNHGMFIFAKTMERLKAYVEYFEQLCRFAIVQYKYL